MNWNVLLYVFVSLLLVASASASEKIGNLALSGDAAFDSDSISSSENQQRRWLSFPGGRLCVNPSSAGRFEMMPVGSDLPLDVGGYTGAGVVRLEKVVRIHVCDMDSVDPDAGLSTSRITTWFPYKMAFSAGFAGGVKLDGYDFFASADSTLIRVLELKGCRGKNVCLAGLVGASAEITLNEQEHYILVSDANYFYALRIVRLEGSQLTPVNIDWKAVADGRHWSVRIPLIEDTAAFALSFGFAAAAEGKDKAIARAKDAFARPVKTSLQDAKSVIDTFLRKVPQPEKWGVDGVDTFGVTPSRHRQEYYAAWAFIYQSVMNVFPENPGYPYPQMSVGKSSLWAEGEKNCPATCGWESFMGLQWLAFVDPETAWNAYEGIMSLVDQKGQLGGESLPSRKAQTAWILHQRLPDTAKLNAVYPAIKRYLLWREQNLRWLFADRNIEEERDIEFVVSWLFDVDYAIKIAGVLGMKEDVDFWQGKVGPMTGNMREWFFSDPARLHQFYFVKEKKFNAKDRMSDRPIMTLTALCLKDLPADMVGRLKEHFLELHNPGKPNDGFGYTKYPDNNLDGYGLIDKGIPGAKAFVMALLRDSVRAGEFAETLELDKAGEVKACGVKPSLFNALNIIEFTWMLNGVRYETGQPVKFEWLGGK